MSNYLFEVCIDSLESAVTAIRSGAARLEVCSALSEGGLTPSTGLVQSIRQFLQQNEFSVTLFAMIRPRGGDFHYSQLDVIQMKAEILQLKLLVDGFVFGCLLPDGQLDQITSIELLKLSKPKQVTFHRAFDLAKDPISLIDLLIDLGFDRILTSGQASSVDIGVDQLRKFIEHAADRILILPGCGINSGNIGTLVQRLPVFEFHSSASKLRKSSMQFVSSELYPCAHICGNTYDFKTTDPAEVDALIVGLRTNCQMN